MEVDEREERCNEVQQSIRIIWAAPIFFRWTNKNFYYCYQWLGFALPDSGVCG
jgi:hypothetical protein